MRIIRKLRIPVKFVYQLHPPINLENRRLIDPYVETSISFDFSISGFFDEKTSDYFNVNQLIFSNYGDIISGVGILCVETNLTDSYFENKDMKLNDFIINFLYSENDDFYLIAGSKFELIKIEYSGMEQLNPLKQMGLSCRV